MISTRRLALCFAIAAVLGTAAYPRTAAAQGVFIGPGDLDPQAWAKLEQQIAQAQQSDPLSFERLADVRDLLPELDAGKRGPMPVVMPHLRSIGPAALMPLLERLAIDAAPRGDLADAAWLAWRTGLLEAAGGLRDPRATPVLEAILDSPQTDHHIIKAAAAAYGKLATDAAAHKLVALSRVVSPKQLPVLAGMGYCRRLVVAQRLAEVLAAVPDDQSAKLVARALGDAGSAWAWQRLHGPIRGEEAAVRALAADALIGAFGSYDADVRRKLTAAVLVVDDPLTPALIQTAKLSASDETRAALDKLAQRYQNSPLHRTP